MIDFHSHFLPNIDDGAKNLDESLEMLRISKKSGVDTVVSTSHCYAFDGSSSIQSFLEKRQLAYSQVSSAIQDSNELYPEIVLGCEVHLVHNLSTFPELPLLCIQNTDYILLEMPSSEWKDEDFEEIPEDKRNYTMVADDLINSGIFDNNDAEIVNDPRRKVLTNDELAEVRAKKRKNKNDYNLG